MQHDLPGLLGARLNPRARAVKVGGKTLIELGAMPIGEVTRFFDGLAAGGQADSEALQPENGQEKVKRKASKKRGEEKTNGDGDQKKLRFRSIRCRGRWLKSF